VVDPAAPRKEKEGAIQMMPKTIKTNHSFVALVILSMVAGLLLWARPSYAADLTVTNTNDCGAGKAEADCMHLGTQIEPIMLSNDDGLGIDWHDSREKEVRRDTSVTWRWDIHASQSGPHYLILNLKQRVNTQAGGEMQRSFEESPFDDYIVRVHATRRLVFANFLGNNWQVFVPIFLTLLTAIVIPLAVFWWKRRNRPGGPGSTSDPG